MFESSPSQSYPPPLQDLTQLFAVVEALHQYNETLQDSIHVLQARSQQDEDTEKEPLDFQSFSEDIWDDQVLENFKPSLLVAFDGKTDP